MVAAVVVLAGSSTAASPSLLLERFHAGPLSERRRVARGAQRLGCRTVGTCRATCSLLGQRAGPATENGGRSIIAMRVTGRRGSGRVVRMATRRVWRSVGVLKTDVCGPGRRRGHGTACTTAVWMMPAGNGGHDARHAQRRHERARAPVGVQRFRRCCTAGPAVGPGGRGDAHWHSWMTVVEFVRRTGMSILVGVHCFDGLV